MTDEPSGNVDAWGRHLRSTTTRCLHVARPGDSVVRGVTTTAKNLGMRVFLLDGSRIADKATLMEEVTRVIRAPEWFGQNWDALLDSLRDLSWVPADAYIILWTSADRLARDSPLDFETFVGVLIDAATRWRRSSVPFHIILLGDEALRGALRLVADEALCEH